MSTTLTAARPDRRIHELKTERAYFIEVLEGNKTAELRKDDRGFRVGDEILLREYLPEDMWLTGYKIRAEITHIITDRDGPWLQDGYAMLSFKVLDWAA